MDIQQTRYTVTDFLEIANLPENANKRLELIDGMIAEKGMLSAKPRTVRYSVIASLIVHALNAHVLPKKVGYVTGSNSTYKITEENTFQPDTAFISKERMPDLEGVVFEVAPDLAVEVISPSETAAIVTAKTRLYLQAGTKIVWTVYPETQHVDVHTLNKNGDVVTAHIERDGTLTGGDALQGFELPLVKIFTAA